MIKLTKYNNPTSFVIFGGTGNLAETKLLPALFDLYVNDILPDKFVVIGLSRKDWSDEEYQNFVYESIERKGHGHSTKKVNEFCKHFVYVSGNFTDVDSYEKIGKALQEFDDNIKQCTNKLFYLAVPPQFYGDIFSKLSDSNIMALCDNVGSWSRLLVEKPFGSDLKTAKALEKQLCELFKEEQIYRIDHYLAKDAIENIISLRFANSILSNSWNNEHIESISILLSEKKDVATRGSFYDGVGALRDVGQNHMLQILALLTMKCVDIKDVTSVRNERALILQSLVSDMSKSIVRGQYEGFTETDGVNSESETETYFRLNTEIDTDMWKGVVFIMEAGKALDRDTAEAIVTFKSNDKCNCDIKDEIHSHKNVLTITFSPEQQIKLSMWVKRPGFDFILEERELELVHTDTVDTHSPEAYERVLYDCISGDLTRFVSGDEVIAAWKFISPVLNAFNELPLHRYRSGSSGSEIN